MTVHDVDVVVVGAGPTGLTAAGDLARAGRSVVLLERRPSINPASRAFATMARTLEVLDARGLADDLLGDAYRAPGVTIFGGARIDLTHLDSPYRFVMVTPQTNVDAALRNYAVAQGADIRRGVEVTGLDQRAGEVTVITKGDDRWRARYVIGADGAHSTVRALVGADFPGKTILSSIVLADVKLTHAPTGAGLKVGSTRNTFAFLAPYRRRDADGSWYRAMVWDRNHQVPDTASVADDEIVGILTQAMGVDLGVLEVSWKSRFHCDERMPGLNRFLRVTPGGLLRTDKGKAKAEENLDGKYLLRSADPAMTADDIALGYKQLLEVERGWRDMKSVLDLRPVFHRLEERIRAHVLLCWLALLLIRVAENKTGQPGRPCAASCSASASASSPARPAPPRQRTELPGPARDLLASLDIDPPRKIHELAAPRT